MTKIWSKHTSSYTIIDPGLIDWTWLNIIIRHIFSPQPHEKRAWKLGTQNKSERGEKSISNGRIDGVEYENSSRIKKGLFGWSCFYFFGWSFREFDWSIDYPQWQPISVQIIELFTSTNHSHLQSNQSTSRNAVSFETTGLIVWHQEVSYYSIVYYYVVCRSSGDGADDYVPVEKRVACWRGENTDKGTWHGMVDLNVHYRFVDASARHGLVFLGCFNVDIVFEEPDVHCWMLRKENFLATASPECTLVVRKGVMRKSILAEATSNLALYWPNATSIRIRRHGYWLVADEERCGWCMVEADCLWLCA